MIVLQILNSLLSIDADGRITISWIVFAQSLNSISFLSWGNSIYEHSEFKIGKSIALPAGTVQ